MVARLHDLVNTAVERHDLRAELTAALWTAPAREIDEAMLALALATEDPEGYALCESDEGGHVVFSPVGFGQYVIGR